MLFGEPLLQAVQRVAHDELGLAIDVGELLGYIEYPSHYENGLDSPVGLAFSTRLAGAGGEDPPSGCAWFARLPPGLYSEQSAFLARRFGFSSERADAEG